MYPCPLFPKDFREYKAGIFCAFFTCVEAGSRTYEILILSQKFYLRGFRKNKSDPVECSEKNTKKEGKKPRKPV
jgi:hypothetical protein